MRMADRSRRFDDLKEELISLKEKIRVYKRKNAGNVLNKNVYNNI